MANIIVYGSGWAGIAAAAKAAHYAPSVAVHLISPYPVAKLGGISTIGGQNYIDLRKWKRNNVEKVVQGGSFEDWYNHLGKVQYYNTDSFAAYLYAYLIQYNNITVHHNKDIKSIATATNPYRITSVTLGNISRNSSGIVVWGTSTQTLACDMIIDASDEGRIARTVNSAVITGRYDWPSTLLTSTEHANGLAKQQAATLMFKITGVNTNSISGDVSVYDGSLIWGGHVYYKTPGKKMYEFNEANKQNGYMLKPLNVARNGSGSNEWWVNMLMVFNVDGRCNNRDIGTSMYPANKLSGTYTTDQAYVNANNFINNATKKQQILEALREIPGFESVNFVYDSNNKVVTGETLYIRETVHMTKNASNIAHATENSNYGLTTTACHNAGANNSTGSDSSNYATRIGIGYYNSDIHPYDPSDCINGNTYVWGYDSYRKMRSDLMFVGEHPASPAYIPYSVLKTDYVANLILAGYAVNMSSFAWGEMRVFPNQAVIGDAAGVTAAYCHNNNKYPTYLGTSDISVIQNNLTSIGAKLNKETL